MSQKACSTTSRRPTRRARGRPHQGAAVPLQQPDRPRHGPDVAGVAGRERHGQRAQGLPVRRRARRPPAGAQPRAQPSASSSRPTGSGSSPGAAKARLGQDARELQLKPGSPRVSAGRQQYYQSKTELDDWVAQTDEDTGRPLRLQQAHPGEREPIKQYKAPPWPPAGGEGAPGAIPRAPPAPDRKE